jgi:hypothetical protein
VAALQPGAELAAGCWSSRVELLMRVWGCRRGAFAAPFSRVVLDQYYLAFGIQLGGPDGSAYN